jgi:cyclopropane fatty-acyl-phospholipid synthase-like methyltransferase
VQLTDEWDERYRNHNTAWEDEEPAPATRNLIRTHVDRGQSVLELGCGRGVDSIWMAQSGFRVTACDVSETAIRDAERTARQLGLQIDFYVADVIQDRSMLPRCDAVFERGLLHTFVVDEGRSLFARAVADLLDPGRLWLSVAGAASTPAEASGKLRRPTIAAARDSAQN